eukprot:TRINITY_DN36679_c0_g2_i1.p1 TRINITY_DN36679_c0_g2~~TRINITY_DN36679_c0_g2_i1.p1  ORF type:complete len:1339 (-),score=190.61 TRINITY_DN36679_c0_g2_i1:390-4364(-)
MAPVNNGELAGNAPAHLVGTTNPKLAIAESALRRHFGHTCLRPFQREAFAEWASGRDVIVTMATGAGKSVCFQLPPLCEPIGRWALIISPLVALMQDQVETLRQRQIPAAFFGSGATGRAAACWSSLSAGAFRIVYMCPEFALANLPQLTASRESICLLGVDEAHCVSSWGHDFRPGYAQLGRLHEALVGVPVMCVTATCTTEVRTDVERSIGLGINAGAKPGPHARVGIARVEGPVNRPNLKYVVRPRTFLQSDLGELFGLARSDDTESIDARRALPIDNTVVGPTASAVIYAGTKARCEEVADFLAGRGVKAAAYHAGMDMNSRRRVHTAFVMDELQVVVATIAFGMGIDKPSIRRVLHYGSVRSLEHYVQQCGRAGRDGDEAECISFTKTDQDATESRNLILMDYSRQSDGAAHCERLLALNAELNAFMSDFRSCRRARLLHHFGERPTRYSVATAASAPKGECVIVESDTDSGVAGDEIARARCGWCDVCLSGMNRVVDKSEGDFSKECCAVLRCVDACGGMTGMNLPLSVVAGCNTAQVRGRRMERHKCFGSGAHQTLEWWKRFSRHLQTAGFLREKAATLQNGRSYAAMEVSQKGRELMAKCNSLEKPTGIFILSPVPEDLAPKKAPTSKVPSKPDVASLPSASLGNDAGSPADGKVVRSLGSGPAPTPEELFRRLAHVRLVWMRRHGVNGEAILGNTVLREFAKVRPTSVDAARSHVGGLPDALGEELVSALTDEILHFCNQTGLPCDLADQSSGRGVPLKRPVEEPSLLSSPPGKLQRVHDNVAVRSATTAAAVTPLPPQAAPKPRTSVSRPSPFTLSRGRSCETVNATPVKESGWLGKAMLGQPAPSGSPSSLSFDPETIFGRSDTVTADDATPFDARRKLSVGTNACADISASPVHGCGEMSLGGAKQSGLHGDDCFQVGSGGFNDAKKCVTMNAPEISRGHGYHCTSNEPLGVRSATASVPAEPSCTTSSVVSPHCALGAASHGTPGKPASQPLPAQDEPRGQAVAAAVKPSLATALDPDDIMRASTPTSSTCLGAPPTTPTHVTGPMGTMVSGPAVSNASEIGGSEICRGESRPSTLEEALAELAGARSRIRELEAERSSLALQPVVSPLPVQASLSTPSSGSCPLPSAPYGFLAPRGSAGFGGTGDGGGIAASPAPEMAVKLASPVTSEEMPQHEGLSHHTSSRVSPEGQSRTSATFAGAASMTNSVAEAMWTASDPTMVACPREVPQASVPANVGTVADASALAPLLATTSAAASAPLSCMAEASPRATPMTVASSVFGDNNNDSVAENIRATPHPCDVDADDWLSVLDL